MTASTGPGRIRAFLLALVGLLAACAPASPELGSPGELPQPIRMIVVGDVAQHTGMDDRTAAIASGLHPDVVLIVGDSQYGVGTAPVDVEDFVDDYDRSWGAFRRITEAVPGDHDCPDPSCSAFRDYFGSGAHTEPSAMRFGSWFVAALDSMRSLEAQTAWLDRELASSDAYCQLLFWHGPRLSSRREAMDQRTIPWWAEAYEHGVDVVAGGNAHQYERFEPMRPDGAPAADGVREFVAGTGGAELVGFDQPLPGSEARVEAHGVLLFTLSPTSYRWRFVDVDGRTRDTGEASCHGD